MAHLLIAAPHKSSGKTTITLGLCSALRAAGKRVQAFKKGPDFIDPMWLTVATGRPCYNLDFHTMRGDEICRLFAKHSDEADLTIIEGNMGLFDSLDVEGSSSNAALAALLGAPVVLVVDVRGATRSIVPVILGFQQFDPRVRIAGLILNNVAGLRHEARLREAIGHYSDLPVLGVIHRDARLGIEERHLGLIPSNEAAEVQATLGRLADTVNERVDLDRLLAVAATATAPETAAPSPTSLPTPDVRIGFARDAAFGFYYPDDLEKLRQAGAELVPIDTLRDRQLPRIDGLFLGGGFPETQMEALEANEELRSSILKAIEADLPVYAECGGLMYLARSIEWKGERRRMIGAIPGDVVMGEKPVGRGYVQLQEITSSHPWEEIEKGPVGPFNAHEFHYSRLINLPTDCRFAYKVVRGSGIDGKHDGFVYKNLLANYAHLRDVDNYHWIPRFVAFVRHKASLTGRTVSTG